MFSRRAIHKVKDLLRQGGRLTRYHDARGNLNWYVVPRSGKGLEVDDKIAQLVIKEADVYCHNECYYLGVGSESEAQ